MNYIMEGGKAYHVMLLMWASTYKVPSRTSRISMLGDGVHVEPSVVRVGLTALARVDLEPTRRTSVTVKFENVEREPVLFLILSRQTKREVGGRVEVGLEDRQSWVSSA